jgi:hypothetical protein
LLIGGIRSRAVDGSWRLRVQSPSGANTS